MQSDTIFAAIKQVLPEASFPDVIAAFRQDNLVWDSLHDKDLFNRFIEANGNNPQRWTPASLALLAIGYPISAADLQATPLIPLDNSIRQRAAKTYEETFRTLKPPSTLQDAGLLALALRERRRLTDAWQGLLTELQINPAATPEIQYQVWHTPLAILFSLTPDAPSLLRALLPKAGAPVQTAQISLVLHGLLSNPLSLNEQSNLLSGLIGSYPVEEQLIWLNILEGSGRARLANELARTFLQSQTHGQLSKTIEEKVTGPHFPLILRSTLRNIAAKQQLASYHHSAGDLDIAVPLLNEVAQTLNRLQAEISGQIGEIHFEKKDLPAARIAFEQSVQLDPENTGYRSDLAICLGLDGKSEDALSVLPETTSDSQVLLTRAYLLHQNGDIVRAQELGRQANQINAESDPKGATYRSNRLWKRPNDIIRIFSGLGLTEEALQTAQSALRSQPTDSALLVAVGQALEQNGSLPASAEALHTAVALEPGSLDFRRKYANLLEKQENWAAAMTERATINQMAETPTLEDLTALANCAVQNGQAETAVRASHAILNMQAENGMAHIFLGKACLLEKDNLGALQHFTQATLLNPEEPQAWLALSHFQKENGDPYKSLETLRAGAHAAPQSPEIQSALAEEYLSSGSPSEALPALRKANSLAPANPVISVRLGDILRDLGHLAESRQVLEQARKTSPTLPNLAYSHSKTLIAMGDFQAAVPALLVTLEAHPEDIEPYLLYSRIMLGNRATPQPAHSCKSMPMNQLDSTYLRSALEKALVLDPENRELKLRLAQALALSGLYEESLEHYQDLVEAPGKSTDELNWQIKLGLGKTALALNNLETALAAIQDAVSLAPNEVIAHQALSEALLEANLKAESLEAAKSAFKLAPRDQSNLEWYSRTAYRLGAHNECVAALERAVELDPTNPTTVLSLARVQIEANNPQGAGETLESIMDLETVDSAALEEIGYVWLTIGDYQAAIRTFEKAILKCQDHSGSLWFKLAQVHAQIGNYEEALEAVQKASNLEPDDAYRMFFQADLLCKLGRNQAALACYEQSLQLQATSGAPAAIHGLAVTKVAEIPLPEFMNVDFKPVKIHLKIAGLLRRQGEISAALTHAEMALEMEPECLNAHSLAAELANSLLDTDSALSLTHYPTPDKTGLDRLQLGKAATETDRREAATLLSIRGELELETGDLQNAMCAVSQALDLSPKHARALAVQARIDIANGDFKSAEGHWEAAVASLNSIPQGIQLNGALSSGSAGVETQPNQAVNPNPGNNEAYPDLTMAQTALDLQMWDTALALFNLAVRQAPMEPRVHLSLARAMVLCAEAEITSQAVRVVTHAPGKDKLTQESAVLFDGVVQAANRLSTHSQITRWHKRGQAVFHPGPQTLRALTGLPANAEDTAAAIAACRRINDMETAIRLASQYPTQPAINLQLALAQRDSAPAEAVLTARTLAGNPQAHPVHLAVFADLALRTGDYLPGLEAIESALEIWPNEPEWRVTAAELNEICQDHHAVVEHLSQAYQIDPENPGYALLLGKAYLKSRQVKEALQYLDTATRLNPNNVEAWTILARAFQAANETLRAIACAEKAVSIAPDQADPLVVCGEIALDAGQFDLVHQHAESALKIDPTNPHALLLLVKVLDVEGEPQEALEALDQFLPTASDPYPLKIERISLIRKTCSSQDVQESLEELDREYADDPWILSQLAEVLAENGNREAAEKAAQTALRLQPEQPELHLLVGRIQRSAGQLDQAIYHLNEAIHQSNQLVEAYLELGRAYQDRRENAQALQIYKKAIQIVPRDARTYYQAGLCLKESKEYVDAEGMLRQAAELAPEDLNIRRQLAAIIALNLVHNAQEASA